jgi:hypothetical protein
MGRGVFPALSPQNRGTKMFDCPQDDKTRRAMYPNMTDEDWRLHDFLELYSMATPEQQAEIMRKFKSLLPKTILLEPEPFVEYLN